MRGKLAFISLLCLVGFGVWVGCEEEEGYSATTDCPPWWCDEVGSVQLVLPDLPNDTLRFLPGDSAYTRMIVIVTDHSGLVLQGIRVYFSLGDSSLGCIEFTDPFLQDTTNALGRVEATYRTFAIAGDQVIGASVCRQTDYAFLIVREVEPLVSRIDITTDCCPIVGDSCYICLTYTDAFNNGVGGIEPLYSISATGGRITPPRFPLTDNTGRCRIYWNLADQIGHFCFFFGADSICCTIE